MNQEPSIRRSARRAGIAVMMAALMFGIAGCTPDVAEQARKVVGEEPSATAPDFLGSVEPIDEEVTPSKPADGEVSADGAGDETENEGTGTDDAEADTETDATEGDDQGRPESGTAHEDSRVPRIHLQIVSVDADLTLKGETYKNANYPGKRGACSTDGGQLNMPMVAKSIAKGEVVHSCLENIGAPELELTYSIPGTKDLLWLYTTIPDIGNNIVKCSVIDPATWKTATDSAYICDSAWMQDNGHGMNPMPKVKLQKKPTVQLEDSAEAQQVLTKFCSKGQPRCDFTAAKQEVKPSPKAQWKVLDTYNNCGPDRKHVARHVWKKTKTFGWENSVGLKASVEGDLPWGKLNAGIGGGFEAAWEFSNKYENTVNQPVPWGYADIFYLQVNYMHITGDINISTADKNYQLKNVTYKLPLAQAWKDERGQTVPMSSKYAVGVKITCPTTPKVGSTGTKMLDGKATPTADKL